MTVAADDPFAAFDAAAAPDPLEAFEQAKSNPAARRRKRIAAAPPSSLQPGNIDLTKRPVVQNSDGTVSTVRSKSFRFDDQGEVLLPTVSDDGRIMSDEEAVQTYRSTGKHLGVFKTVAEANAYAEQLHKDQEQQYAPSEPPEREGAVAAAARARMASRGESPDVVKRRAAAGEPIVQQGLHRPSATEALASSTVNLAAGAGEGLAQMLTVPADVATASTRASVAGIGTMARGGSYKDAVRAGVDAATEMPSTRLATEAADDFVRTGKRVLGVREGAITDVGDAANRLAGQIAAPLPEVVAGRTALTTTRAGREAAEAALRRDAARGTGPVVRAGEEVAESGLGIMHDGAAITPSSAVPEAQQAAPAAANSAKAAVRNEAGSLPEAYRDAGEGPAPDVVDDLSGRPGVFGWLAQDPAKDAVYSRLPSGTRVMSAGEESAVLAAPDGNVVRISRATGVSASTPRPNIPEVLQPIGTETVGNWQIEVLPRVRPFNRIPHTGDVPPELLQAEVSELLEKLHARGYEMWDVHPGNFGRTAAGELVVIDGGAVRPVDGTAELLEQAGAAQQAARERPAGVRAPEQAEPDFVGAELARKRGEAPASPEAVQAQPRRVGPKRPVEQQSSAALEDGGGSGSPPSEPLTAEPAGRLPPSARGPKTVSDRITDLREFVEDDWIRVKNLMREPGVKFTEASDPYTAEILMHGRIGARMEAARAAVVDIDRDVLRSARSTGTTPERFAADVDRYLHARHAPERNAHLGDGAAGLFDDDARDVLTEIDSSPHGKEVARVAERLQEMSNQTLDVLLESEIIDKELYDTLRARYKNHIPLNRVTDDVDDIGAMIGARPLDVRSSGLRTARGSGRAVADITTNIVANYEQALVRAEKNRVDLATLRFARDNPQLELFTEMHPRAIGERFPVAGQEGRAIILQQMNDPQVLTMREGGKTVQLRIEDPALAAALRGVGRYKVDGVLRVVGNYTRFMASLATRFNPEFFLPNKFRDLQEAMIYAASKGELGAKGALKVATRDASSIRAVMDGMRGRNTPGGRLYRQMQLDGGTTGGMGLSTRKAVELDIEKIRKVNRSAPRLAAQKLVGYLNDLNGVFEDSTRLSVYQTALERGASRDRAARLAKEASINFNKTGRGGPQINALYMFANASVQGSAKMLRAMKNPKVAGAVVTALGVAVASVNEWNDQLDPEWRNKVSVYDRKSGLPVMLPPSADGSVNYFVVPVSWGLKPIKIAMDYAFDAMAGKGVEPGEAVAGSVAAAVDAYNPVGGTDLTSAVTPTLIDLPVDIGRNRSWSGGMIRPEFDPDQPDSARYFPDLAESATGRIAIGASEQLSDRGIEVSPANIKYAYDSLVGGTGRATSKVVNTITAAGSGELPKTEDVPIVSRFLRNVSPERVEQRIEAVGKRKESAEAKKARAKELREERARKRAGQH